MPVVVISNHEERLSIRKIKSSAPFILKNADFPALPTAVVSSGPSVAVSAEPGQSWSGAIQYSLIHPIEEVQIEEDEAVSNSNVESAKVVLSQPTFSRFLDLPNELRLAIWTLALQFIDQVAVRDAVKRGDDPTKPKFLPDLCATSEKTFEETVVSFINASKILVCSYNDNQFLRAFLEAAAGCFETVRQLDFNFFSRYKGGTTENADLELAVGCTGLRTITLGFHKEELTFYLMVDEEEMQCETRPRSATHLFSKYKLERLLDCGMLKTIIIEHSGYFSEAAEEAVEKLGEMLEQRFAAKESKQVVKVVYTRKARLPRGMSNPWYY